MEMAKILFFGLSDEGQDNLSKIFPYKSSQIWASAIYRNNSRVNCLTASRDFLSEEVHRNGTLKSCYFRFFQKNIHPKKIERPNVYSSSVVPNDRLVVEPLYKKCEGDSLCADGRLEVKIPEYEIFMHFKSGMEFSYM
jgi:hypothetical protein